MRAADAIEYIGTVHGEHVPGADLYPFGASTYAVSHHKTFVNKDNSNDTGYSSTTIAAAVP